MALEHARGGGIDRQAVGHVAGLVLIGIFRSAPGQPDDVPSLPAEGAADGGADPG
jgi:hypothetical protein